MEKKTHGFVPTRAGQSRGFLAEQPPWQPRGGVLQQGELGKAQSWRERGAHWEAGVWRGMEEGPERQERLRLGALTHVGLGASHGRGPLGSSHHRRYVEVRDVHMPCRSTEQPVSKSPAAACVLVRLAENVRTSA